MLLRLVHLHEGLLMPVALEAVLVVACSRGLRASIKLELTVSNVFLRVKGALRGTDSNIVDVVETQTEGACQLRFPQMKMSMCVYRQPLHWSFKGTTDLTLVFDSAKCNLSFSAQVATIAADGGNSSCQF